MRCPNCGGFLTDGAKFCVHCGAQMAPVHGGQAPPPPVQRYQQQQYSQHPPQTMRGHPPPPPMEGSAFNKILVFAVAVVILVPVVVVVAWAMTSSDDGGGGPPYEEDIGKITVNFASPSVQKFDRASSGPPAIYVWDAVLNINKITPKEERVLWTEVRILVKSDVGSVLQTATSMSPDGSATYDDDDGGYIDVEFWFVETTSGDTKMSAGDAIKITGMPSTWEGATIEITKAGERIGSISLPTNFP